MRLTRDLVQDVLAVLGAAVVAAGLYLWEPPVAAAFCGALLMAIAVRLE
jgi:hypothetical protein